MDLCDDDSAFIQARITAVEAQIVAAETKLATLTAAAAGYELDTGQTKQRVTQHDLAKLQEVISSLMNRRATLRALLYGGSTRVVPSF